jgi:hypothetical protein
MNIAEIKISVPSDIADAYQQASQDEKDDIQRRISMIIHSQLKKSRQNSLANLRQAMDAMSQEAQSNGLTPEILASILQDEN